MTTSPPDAPLTDEQRDEWSHALQYIHEDDRAVLEYARTWADSWSVDYDEGPCAIEFKKDGASYWYLIDDIGWDADDPRTELIVEALRDLKAAREELARMRSSFEHVDTQCRRIGDRNAEAMRILGVEFGHPTEGVAEGALRVVTERDSLRDQLTTMTRERDEARANAVLEAQHHHHLRAERDALRARLAECERENDRLASLVRNKDADSTWTATEAADETAEQIAAWLSGPEPMCGAPSAVVTGPLDKIVRSALEQAAKSIRAGAWRKP